MDQHDNTTPFRAADYDANVRGVIPFYEQLHDQTVDLVRTARPDVRAWLDTGCGTGTLVHKALPVFQDTRFVLADPSENMLEQARGRFTCAGADRVTFVHAPTCGDLACHLPEPPQVITAIMCHHYLAMDQRYGLAQTCFELLDAGGVYVSFEHVRPYNDQALRIGLARWQRFQVTAGRTEQEAQETAARFGKELQPITVNMHMEILRSAGFRTVALLWAAHLQAGFYAIK